MDGWVPKGGSLPPGDGAFERFLTAAIAAIITIMFSWRLLDDMNDAEADESERRRRAAVYGASAASAKPSGTADRQIVELDIDGDDSGVVEGVNSPAGDMTGFLPQSDSGYYSLAVSSGSVDGQNCTSVDLMKCFTSAPPVYLPSDAPGFHAGDFSLDRNAVSDMDTTTARDSNTDSVCSGRAGADDSRELSDSDREMLEDGTTCFEWPAESGDDFCNVSGDSDEVQPRELDSDEELYCCSLLEPIIEEDSDDFLNSSDDRDSLKHPHQHLHPHICPSPNLLSLDPKQTAAAAPRELPQLANKPSPQAVVEDVFQFESPLIPARSDNSSSHSQDADDSDSDESVQTVVHRGSASSDSKESSLESSPLHGPRFFHSDHDTPLLVQPSQSPADRYGVSVPCDVDSVGAYAQNVQDAVSEGFEASGEDGVGGSGQDGDSLEEEESTSSEDSDSEGEKTLDDIPLAPTQVHTAEVDTEVSSADLAPALHVTLLSAEPSQAPDTKTLNPYSTVVVIDPARNVHAEESSTPDDALSGGDTDTFIHSHANHVVDSSNTPVFADFHKEEEIEPEFEKRAEAGTNSDESAQSESGTNPKVFSETKPSSVIDSFLTEFEDEPFARRTGRRERSPGRGNSFSSDRDRSPCRRDGSPGFRDRSPGRRNRSPGRRDTSPGRSDRSPEADADIRSRHPETSHAQDTHLDRITKSDTEPDRSAKSDIEPDRSANSDTEPDRSANSDTAPDRSANSDTEPDKIANANPFLVELEDEPFVMRPRDRDQTVAKTDPDFYSDQSPKDRDTQTHAVEQTEKEVRKDLDPLLTEFEEEPFARRRGGGGRPSAVTMETDIDDLSPAVAMETDIDDVSPSESRPQAAKDTHVERESRVTKKPDPAVMDTEEEPFARRQGVGSDRVSIKSDSEFDRSAKSDTDSYKSGKNDSDLDRSVGRKSDTHSIDSYLIELDEEPFARRVGRRRRSPDRKRETEGSRAAAETSASAKTKRVTDSKTLEAVESPTISKPTFSPPPAADAGKDTALVPDSPSVSLPPSFSDVKQTHHVTSTPQRPDWGRATGKALPIPESPTICMPALIEQGPSRSLSPPVASETSAGKLRPSPFSDATVSSGLEEMPRGYTFMRCESESSRSERRIFLVDKPFFPDFETLINSVPCTSESVGELEGAAAMDYDEYSAFVQDLHRPALSSETEFTQTFNPSPSLGDACILSGNLVSPPAVEVFQFPQPLLPAVSSVSQNLYRKDDADSEDLCSDADLAGQTQEDRSSKAEGSSGDVLDTSFDIDSTVARERMEADFAFLQAGNNVRLPAFKVEERDRSKKGDDLKGSLEGREDSVKEGVERMDDRRARTEDRGDGLDERLDGSDDERSDEGVDRNSERRRRRRRRGDSGERGDDRKRRKNNRRGRLGDGEFRSGDSIDKNEGPNEIPDSRKEEKKEMQYDRKEPVDDRKDRPDDGRNKFEDEISEKSQDKRASGQPEKDTLWSEQAQDTMPSEQAHDIIRKTEKSDSYTPSRSDTTAKLEEGAPILFFQPATLIYQDITPVSVEPRRIQPQKPPRGERRADSGKGRQSCDRTEDQAVEKKDSFAGGREDNFASKEDSYVERNEEGLEKSPGADFVSDSSESPQLFEEAPRPKPRQTARPTPMPRSKSLGDTSGTPSGEAAFMVEDDVFQTVTSPADSDSRSSLKDNEEEEEELLFQQKHNAPLAFGDKRPRSLKEIRRKLHQQRTNPRPMIAPFTLPDHMVLPSRLKIMASRRQFLSSENIDSSGGSSSLQEQFAAHKLSQQQVKERRYKSPNKRLSSSAFSSQDQLEKLNYMLNYSRHSESSFDRSLVDHLHEDCILTPEGRRNILDKTLSIENLQVDLPQHLRKYGSVTSLVETDIDTGETLETNFFPETNLDIFDCLFQSHQPLQRSVSMSDLVVGEQGGEGHDQKGLGFTMAPPSQTHKSTGKGRFAYRKYQKSKSLCTLETNLDDVGEEGETLKRVPSVHELRVSKSLQKLNVPDWFKQSSLSKSSSCLLKYGSNSTMNSFSFSPSLVSSPCASTAPPAPNVVIRTRVVPSSNPRGLRSPGLLSPSDKKAPPVPVKLPSEKLREKEKNKNLMPIPIIPFAQIRAMFEKKGKAEDEKEKKVPAEEKVKIQHTEVAKHSFKTTSAVPSISISRTEEEEPSREQSKPAKRTLFADQPSRTLPSSAGDTHKPTVSSPSSQPQTVPRPAHTHATNGVSDGVDGVTVVSPSVKSVFVRTEESSPPSSSAVPAPEKQPSSLASPSVEQKPGRDLKDSTRKDASKDSQKEAQKSADKDSKQQFSPTRSLRQFFGRSKDKSSEKKSESGGGSSLDSSFSSGDGVYEKEPRRLGVSEVSKRFDARTHSTAPAALVSRGSGKDARSDLDSSFSSGDGVSPRTGEGVPPKDSRTSQSKAPFPASGSSRPSSHYNNSDRPEPSKQPLSVLHYRPEASEQQRVSARFNRPEASEPPTTSRFSRPEVSDAPKFQRRLPGAGTTFGRLPSTENGDHVPESAPASSTGTKAATDKKSIKETTV